MPGFVLETFINADFIMACDNLYNTTWVRLYTMVAIQIYYLPGKMHSRLSGIVVMGSLEHLIS